MSASNAVVVTTPVPSISTAPIFFTATSASAVAPTAAIATSSPAPDSWALDDLLDDIADLEVASAAFLIGLVLASL